LDRQPTKSPSALSTEGWLITDSYAYGHPWPGLVALPDAIVARHYRQAPVSCLTPTPWIITTVDTPARLIRSLAYPKLLVRERGAMAPEQARPGSSLRAIASVS